MNQQTSTECPQPGVLVEFLQGKLQPPQLGQCETHLKDCTMCHETLVGLSSNDTLSERVMAALQNDEAENFLNESSVETQSLLDRLTSDDFKRSSMAAGLTDGQRNQAAQTAQTEIIADRAAEILRCVTPSEDSLGKLGDYTLVRLIGAGSTGVVFQAIDETLDRTVALKVLRPSLGEISRSRFLIEAKLAASIEHVNVVTIFQVGQVDRLAFMAMPWLPGQTLESLLASSAQGEPLDDNQIIEIIRQVAAGLDAAHQQQLVHRDIKPANLWICEDDQRLKILDFGLARISDDNPSLTMTGMLAGTPNFMSPEQTRGLELDGRSDLFSLGCVLYRLLAGRLPFGSPTVLATLSSIQSHTPVPPTELGQDINQDLSDLTMCLLEKQPINRPQSASQTIELLTTPRDQWPIVVPAYSSANVAHGEANQPAVAKPVKVGSGRGWSAWIPTAIGLLLLGGFGWLLATQVIRISTPDGEVVIETSDENVEVQVLQDGKEVLVIDTKTQQSFTLKSGQYSFNAKATDGETENSFTIEPQTLTMHRGDKAIVKVTVEPNEKVEVEQPASVAAAPSTKINKPIYDGRTFAQWLQAAKFDRAAGAKVAASLGCARTAETDDEWAQFLDVAASLLVKKNQTSEDRAAVRGVLQAIDTEHLFGFVKLEIALGNSASLPLFRNWFRTYFKYENPPPFPWEQINELTDVISQNSNKPGVLEFLQPILDNLYRIDGPEADRYLTSLQTSPAGKHIKELALTGDLQEKFDVFHLAINIFNDKEVRESFKNDLLDPDLNNKSVMVKSISKPWPAVKPPMISHLLRAMDPDRWRAFDDNDVDKNAEAAYVSEASDLLIKVTDGFLKKELLFSDSLSKQAYWSNGFLDVVSSVFFDVVQRTSDKNLKHRLLKSFESIRASLAPETLDDDDEMNRSVQDLDYVIAFCKDFPPSRLPPNSRLYPRKPRKKPVSKVEKVASVAETKETATTANKPLFAGKTFAQWLDAAQSNLARQKVRGPEGYQSSDANGTTAVAIIGCLKTVETDDEWAQLLDVTISCKTERDSGGIIADSRRAVEDVREAVSADHLFVFVESEIVQGKTTSLRLFSDWFRERLEIKDPPPLPWKQINELTDLINQNVDKPGGLEFLTQILLSMRSIDGPEAKAYVTKLRNSPAGKRVREIASTGNLQRRFDVHVIALSIFDDDAVREIYRRDLFDSKLSNKRVYSSFGPLSLTVYSSSKTLPWNFLRGYSLNKLFTAMDPEYWTWDNDQLDATAETKYVAEAADLLAKVADEFAAKQLPGLFFGEVLERFFDVAQRTSDESIKQRMLQKLEVIKESLDPKRLPKKSISDLDYVIAFYKGNPPAELPRRTALRVRKPKNKPAKKVEQTAPVASFASEPATQINKPFFEGKTFAQWLHAAKFDRAKDATANAILGCVKTVETDEEWAQLLEMIISFKIEYIKGRENVKSRQAYDAVIKAVSADHLFDFVESEVVQGKFASLGFYSDWFRKRFRNSDPPPRPWKQINKLIGFINENHDKLDAFESPKLPFSLPAKPVLRLLTPIFSYMPSIDSLEAQTCITNLRNSPAGKRIRERALTGDMQQRFKVYEVALSVFDEVAIRDIYKRDLLDPKLSNGSLISDSAPLFLSHYREGLIPKIFTTMDPEYWAWDKQVVSAAAEAKYVTEASDLLVEIADDFLERRSLFSKGSNGRPHFDYAYFFSSMMLGKFFDVAQRTNDESIKQRLLKKLEAIRLADKNKPAELDYVIAYCKGEPLAKLPHRTYLRLRKTDSATAKPLDKGKPQQNGQQFLMTTDAPNEKPSFKNGASTLLEINIAAVTESGKLNAKSPTWAKLKIAVEDRLKVLQTKGPNNLLHVRFFISKDVRQSLKSVAAMKAHVNKVLADTDMYVVCVDITSVNSEMTWENFVNQK